MRDKPELAAFAVTRKLNDQRVRAQCRVRNRSLCDMAAFCAGPGFFPAAARHPFLFVLSQFIITFYYVLYLGCKPIKIWPIGPWWAHQPPTRRNQKKKKTPSAVKNFPASIETKRKDITIPSLRESGSISIPVPYEGEFLYLSHKIFSSSSKRTKMARTTTKQVRRRPNDPG